MTDPQAIAEKILDAFTEIPEPGLDGLIIWREKCIQFIAASLTEYGEACVERCLGEAAEFIRKDFHKKAMEKAHAQGRAEALEEAAKVAANLNYNGHSKCGQSLAFAIRALSQSEKGKGDGRV